MVAMRIGQLDQRVTFQSETTADDGQGGRTSSGWANIATTPTMWANVTLTGAAEGDQGEQRQANTYSINVVVRARSDVTELMRVVWRARNYNIRATGPYDARREFMLIQAQGGVVE